MIDLQNIASWKQKLGLLPIQLRYVEEPNNYLLLNGGEGDFCLETTTSNSTSNQYYSKAWSSGTKNFLTLEDDNIKIFNWANDKIETTPISLVSSNIEKFYKYLLKKSYKTSNDVVPHVIDIFRQFRNLTSEHSNPTEALSLLFVLLASLEDDIHSLDFAKWNIGEVNLPDAFDDYTSLLNSGPLNITPSLELIMRHSSGTLFQEAQKEVLYFNRQIEIFGGISSNITTKNNLYSSIHYTPPYLSRTIVENSLKQIDLTKESIKILDPACGSGEFLIEALKQLKELGYDGQINIIGWDSSETAILTSSFLLKYEQRIYWQHRLNFQLKLVSDSLLENWDNDYDLILMNPPFVSWELLSKKEYKEAIRETLGENFMGRPNQASAFFYKSIMSLNENGVFGFVIPSSILTLDSYKKLRSRIEEIITFNLIGKLGNFVFEDALTDVSLIVGKKAQLELPPLFLWTRNEKGIANESIRVLRKMESNNQLSISKNTYSIFRPDQFPVLKESWRPISYSNNNFLKKVNRFLFEEKLVTVGEIFRVRQGIRQGRKNVFKITKEELNQLPEGERTFFRPVIDNDAVLSNLNSTKDFIWYPYNSDGLIITTEEHLENMVPTFYEDKLLPNKGILNSRSGINNWWGLTRPRNWQFAKKVKLVSGEFGNNKSFALDETGEYVVERGNAWLPKKSFKDDYYYFYLAIFSSSLFNKLLSIYSRQLAGGKWYDLGKKYTNDIPIPNIHLESVRSDLGFVKLVRLGKEISSGFKNTENFIDDLLYLYYPSSEI